MQQVRNKPINSSSHIDYAFIDNFENLKKYKRLELETKAVVKKIVADALLSSNLKNYKKEA